MEYWNMSNRQFAERDTLHRVIGYLSAFEGKQVSADQVAAYIQETVKEIESYLNERFPERKEK